MVMEKSWNMKKCPKVMEFCDQSWNFANFVPKFVCFLTLSLSKYVGTLLPLDWQLSFGTRETGNNFLLKGGPGNQDSGSMGRAQ